ncbi:hypothetical protein GCM10028814_26960 [Angustibacter aerolatus]
MTVVVLGLVLAASARQDARAAALSQGRAQAAVIQQMALAPALRDLDLDHLPGHRLDPASVQQLRQATLLAVANSSVIGLRVRDADGIVLFSDNGQATSPVEIGSTAFRDAVAGRSYAAIVPADAEGGAVVRVVGPLIVTSAGRASGVFELDLPYGQFEAVLRDRVHRTVVRLGVALGGMYLVLAAIAWSTTNSLRRHARQREHEARHDQLTGLPNRGVMREEVQRLLRSAATGRGGGAVALVDLDRFKEVNDTLGHHVGDGLLQVVAQRLSGALRTDDTVARLGGDEFGIVLPGVTTAEDAAAVCHQVLQALVDDVVVEGVPLRVEASLGVALCPDHGDSVEELLRHADESMYVSKRESGGVVVWEPGEHLGVAEDVVSLRRELANALERDELVLHYQTQVDLRTGRVVGVEALCRWQHPTRGLLAPPAFLHVLETSQLVEPFTEWVVRRALADRARWVALGHDDLVVAVNVSPRNLVRAGLAAVVADALAATGTPPAGLMIEITEDAVGAETEAAHATLEGLTALGVPLSIDDFGAGRTSVAQLRSLQFAQVKVDRSFTAGLTSADPLPDRAVVASVIAMAHGLGLDVVAEGVEDDATRAWLADAGCDVGQGWHFSRPAAWSPDLVARTDRTAHAGAAR